MAVEQKTQDQEEKAQEQEVVKEKQEDFKESEFMDGLVNSLDLPADKAEETKEEETKEEDEEAQETDEVKEVEEEEDIDEDVGDDEDVVPSSKVRRMQERMEKRINQLTAEVHRLKASPKDEAPKDADRVRLEKMSKKELVELKRQVRVAQAKSSDDDEKLNQLVDLEMKIDDVMSTSSTRLEQAQLKNYQIKAQEVMADPDIDDIEKASPKILEIARDIYSASPEFQKSVQGQARALELAVRHYKKITKLSNGKSKLGDLKRQNTKLKRKTSLDSSAVRRDAQNTRLNELRNKAFRDGDSYDKEALIKEDPMFNIDALIPDEFKQR